MQPEGLIMEWSPEQVQQDYLRASRMRAAVAD